MVTRHDATQLTLPYEEAEALLVIPKSVPFIKWAGGKRKLVATIIRSAPNVYERYLEPFVGGGAVALALGHESMLLNDANSELINTYIIVRDNLAELLPSLEDHRRRHSKEYFYTVRAQNPISLKPVEQAARFIYLNKTCFNGLYRVNKNGYFNVPFGGYKNPILFNENEIRIASLVLQNAELFNQNYHTFILHNARAGDFIYLDPPYIPISQFSDFKRYTKEQFRENDQLLLAQLYNNLIELGAYPILSNSYSELTLDLYARHHIQIVYMSRNINHEGTGREPIPEILVKPRVNYDIH